MPFDRTLTGAERAEMFQAYVERFRLAEIGVGEFRQLSLALGIPASDINEARDRYSDESADALLKRLGRAI